MKKTFIWIIAAIAIAGIVSVPSDKARAGLNDYQTFFTALNVYDSEDLTLGFASLDSTYSYRWTVQLVDIHSGEPFLDVGTYTHVPGTTTDAFTVGPSATPPFNYIGDWPLLYTGPYQVQDSHGQIVVRGFVAPDPDLYSGGGEWKSGGGNNAWVDKVVMGSPTHVVPDQNPVYNDISVDGWHYEPLFYTGASVNAISDQIALMHFNLDCATYIGAGYGANDGYYIYDFSGTQVAFFPLNELIDFQEEELIWPPGGCGSANNEVFESFIPVNLDGTEKSYLDHTRASNIFTSNDNPFAMSFEPGAYYIQKRVGGGWISDGEAPFFVSNATAGREYRIDISAGQVVEGANINITYRAATPEIWTYYHGSSECQNDQMTWNDTTVYSYAAVRTENRPVPNSAVDNDFIECGYVPLTIGTAVMTTTEAGIIVESDFYDVVAGAPGIEDNIQTFIEGAKLDTENGKNTVFAFVMFFAMLILGMTPARTKYMAWVLVWTAVGGLWATFGPATPVGQLMFVIITVVLWVLMFTNNDDTGEKIET